MEKEPNYFSITAFTWVHGCFVLTFCPKIVLLVLFLNIKLQGHWRSYVVTSQFIIPYFLPSEIIYNGGGAVVTVPAYFNQQQYKAVRVHTWDNVIDFVTSL